MNNQSSKHDIIPEQASDYLYVIDYIITPSLLEKYVFFSFFNPWTLINCFQSNLIRSIGIWKNIAAYIWHFQAQNNLYMVQTYDYIKVLYKLISVLQRFRAIHPGFDFFYPVTQKLTIYNSLYNETYITYSSTVGKISDLKKLFLLQVSRTNFILNQGMDERFILFYFFVVLG